MLENFKDLRLIVDVVFENERIKLLIDSLTVSQSLSGRKEKKWRPQLHHPAAPTTNT
jgi:hypothetical protein